MEEFFSRAEEYWSQEQTPPSARSLMTKKPVCSWINLVCVYACVRYVRPSKAQAQKSPTAWVLGCNWLQDLGTPAFKMLLKATGDSTEDGLGMRERRMPTS